MRGQRALLRKAVRADFPFYLAVGTVEGRHPFWRPFCRFKPRAAIADEPQQKLILLVNDGADWQYLDLLADALHDMRVPPAAIAADIDPVPVRYYRRFGVVPLPNILVMGQPTTPRCFQLCVVWKWNAPHAERLADPIVEAGLDASGLRHAVHFERATRPSLADFRNAGITDRAHGLAPILERAYPERGLDALCAAQRDLAPSARPTERDGRCH